MEDSDLPLLQLLQKIARSTASWGEVLRATSESLDAFSYLSPDITLKMIDQCEN